MALFNAQIVFIQTLEECLEMLLAQTENTITQSAHTAIFWPVLLKPDPLISY